VGKIFPNGAELGGWVSVVGVAYTQENAGGMLLFVAL
jgi:hypothetical protein